MRSIPTKPCECLLHCKVMDTHQAQVTIDACVRLGDRLTNPKVADVCPLQTFYGRQKNFTVKLKEQKGGQQFLRLAIALVSCLEIERAAEVLARVLEDQEDAEPHSSWPSRLEPLLPRTEWRAKAQFKQLIGKWRAESMLRSCYGPGRKSILSLETCPDVDGLVLLIQELRNVINTKGQVVFYAASGWPWAMALLEWLLGPPLSGRPGKPHRFRCGVSIVLEKRTKQLELLRVTCGAR